jgi:large subunit ribosomal protein L19
MSDEEKKVEAEATPAPEAPKEEPKAEAAPEAPAQEAVVQAQVEEEAAKHKGEVITTDKLRSGMTIRVHERIKDVSPKGEERERIQVFQGIVTGIRGGGIQKTMTVRRVQKGYGVEKIYPLNSPVISKLELVKTAKVRRAKLAFLGDLRHPFKRKMKEEWVDTGA